MEWRQEGDVPEQVGRQEEGFPDVDWEEAMQKAKDQLRLLQHYLGEGKMFILSHSSTAATPNMYWIQHS